MKIHRAILRHRGCIRSPQRFRTGRIEKRKARTAAEEIEHAQLSHAARRALFCLIAQALTTAGNLSQGRHERALPEK